MSLKIIENGTIRKLGYGFLFDFRSNWPYFASFTRYSDWSKIVIFSYPLHLTPLLGVPRHNIAKPRLVRRKLEWCGYPTVKKF